MSKLANWNSGHTPMTARRKLKTGKIKLKSELSAFWPDAIARPAQGDVEDPNACLALVGHVKNGRLSNCRAGFLEADHF